MLAAMRTAMPDMTLAEDVVVAQGDWVAVVYTVKGKFTEPLVLADGTELRANKRRVQAQFSIFFHFNEQGQITESWVAYDNMNIQDKLGTVYGMGY